MTVRVKEKIKTIILILHSIIILTSTIILLSNVRYCEACERRYIGFKNVCNVCLGLNGIVWHNN